MDALVACRTAALALGIFAAFAPSATAQDDVTGNLTTLSMAKTHDESCDVLDTRARVAFRRAVFNWIGSLKKDEETKSRIRKSWAEAGPDPSHDCAGMQFLEVVLWRFRDAKGEDPRAQFKFMMVAKDFELKCHALSTAGLRSFYTAGLSWIANSVTDEQRRAQMTAEWQRSTASAAADCEKQAMIDFMITWTFRATAGDQ